MKKIKLLNNKGYILVDNEDFEIFSKYRWYLSTSGYAQRNFYDSIKYKTRKIRNSVAFMHREIMKANGRLQYVDHINGNKLDNRKSNLRLCTPQESNRHLPARKNTASGYKGVTWYKPYAKWRTRINVDKKDYYLGYFDDPKEAAQAYNRRASELFGEFALLNKI